MALSKITKKRAGIVLAAASITALGGLSPAASASEEESYELELDLKAGTVCDVTIRNQESVHKDTNVEITVGDKTYVLKDVEGEANKVTKSESITVTEDGGTARVVLGPDGVSSLKSGDITCEAPKAKPVAADPTYTG